MKKFKYIIIISICCITALFSLKPVGKYLKNSFVKIITTQLDKEEKIRNKKIENGDIVRGKDTVLIWKNTYEIWNHMGEKHLSVIVNREKYLFENVIEKITDYKVAGKLLYIISQEGYAVIDSENLCRVFITVDKDEFIKGYTIDKDGNKVTISRYIKNDYIKYLDSYDEFTNEDKTVFKSMTK